MAEPEEKRGWDTPTQPRLPRVSNAKRSRRAGVEFDLPLEEVIARARLQEDERHDEDKPHHHSAIPSEPAGGPRQPARDANQDANQDADREAEAFLGTLLAYLLVVAILAGVIALVVWIVVQLAVFILGCIAGVVLLGFTLGALAQMAQ